MRKARLGCRESCAAVDQHGNGAILPTILAKVIWHLVVEDTGFNMRIANIKWSLNHFSNKCQKCPNHQLWPSSPPPRLHQVLSFPGLKQRAFLGYAVSRHPKNQPELTVAFEILMVMLANRFKRLRDVALWPKRSKYAMSQCICWRVDRNIFQWKHLRWSQLSTTLKNIDPKQRITVYKLYIIEMLIWDERYLVFVLEHLENKWFCCCEALTASTLWTLAPKLLSLRLNVLARTSIRPWRIEASEMSAWLTFQILPLDDIWFGTVRDNLNFWCLASHSDS